MIDLERLELLEYLNLSEEEAAAAGNPMVGRWPTEPEEYARHVLRFMRQPENVWYACHVLLDVELAPFQCVTLAAMMMHRFPMVVCSRGFSKSFLLAVYSILKAVFYQGSKIVLTGSGFRQSKTIFNYIDTLWRGAPVLRSLFTSHSASGPHRDSDRWTFVLGESTCVALPIGDGEKIRGERANVVVADEFHCLDASTIVETDRGLMRLADSFGEPGFELLTGNGYETEAPDEFIKTPKTDAYKVVTKGGYEFVCSSIHKVMTDQGWKLARKLSKGDRLEFANHYEFPKSFVSEGDLVVDENLGWLMGILTSEGVINDTYSMSVHMTDEECVGRARDSILRAAPGLHVPVDYREGGVDDRGWTFKPSYTARVSNRDLRDRLVVLGLDRAVAIDKKIPWAILRSPREVVLAYLRGLFEGDGSAFHFTTGHQSNRLGIAYYSVSETLCREVQVLLKKLGVFCTRQPRASKLSENVQWMLRLNGDHALRFQEMIQVRKWDNLYETAHRKRDRGIRKGVVWCKHAGRWKEGTYVGGKVKHVGMYASQAEATAVLDEMECGVPEYLPVRSVEKLPGTRHLYDYHIPVSHSFMGNGFRQHNSINAEVFETVIANFGVVSLSPISQAKRKARLRVLKKMGALDSVEAQETVRKNEMGNQIVFSGTASFQFNHFYKYWKQWKGIVESRGDTKLLRSACGGDVDEATDWRDYCIVRVPVELLPEGYMDAAQVARARHTNHESIFRNEFGAVFSSDSDGFFRRSLIESCCTSQSNPVVPNADGARPIWFDASVRGSPAYTYVMGVDPAAQKDNFAITILEVHPDHRRVVYCWTTDKKRHQAKVEGRLVEQKDYYGYCARKIRDLLKAFRGVEVIALDAQGGGQSGVLEALHDPDKMEEGELPIWPITPDHPLSDGKKRSEDDQAGLHMVELVQFANAEYTSGANHGLKKDMEDRVILFPQRDSVTLGEAFLQDSLTNRMHDTLEECVDEIDDMKDELTSIVYSQTQGAMRDRWDTPDIKLPGSKKGRQRKDRYSALVMANYAARRLHRQFETPDMEAYGGFVDLLKLPAAKSEPFYSHAPDWFTKDSGGGDFGHMGFDGV